jgi:hypothetical protein
VLSRAEAQIIRLCLIYAALRGSSSMNNEDLAAARAVWRYCEDSARFIFGPRFGNPIADKILSALRKSPDGLCETDISGLFGRNVPADKLKEARAALERDGLITKASIGTNGRAKNVWRAVRC